MALNLQRLPSKKPEGQTPALNTCGKQSQGVEKRQPARRSIRLHQRNSLNNIDRSSQEPSLQQPCRQYFNRKRKRTRQDVAHPEPSSKRRGAVPNQSSSDTLSERDSDPILHWILEGKWPKEFLEQDSQTRRSLLEKRRDWPSDIFEFGSRTHDFFLQQKNWVEENRNEEWFEFFLQSKNHKKRPKSLSGIQRFLPRKKPSSSGTAVTPSDQRPREQKSAQYTNPKYEEVLASNDSFMAKAACGITDASKSIYKDLLSSKQTIPPDTLFQDDLFEETCDSVRCRNEAMVVRHITPLICPSAQVLRIYGAKSLKCLTESVNEGWNSCIPVIGTRPQPDYSVGFDRRAFSDEQQEKLKPFVGEVTDDSLSLYMATWRMLFPFLTCEVKCGALDVADRQNAHSMTIAVRAVVELFRLVNREKELHREILAFSISHDYSSVRIYGHYPVIEGDKTSFYRHPIHKFFFTAPDGKEKWTAYKFTKNVYEIWMPKQLERICSAVDDIPANIDFEVSQSELKYPDETELQLSQELEAQFSQQSNAESVLGKNSQAKPQYKTPETSVSREPEFKRPKKRAAS